MSIRVIILAAGLGTRMRSALPKMLHPICGKPMVAYSLDAVRAISDEKPLLVIGHGADAVREAVGEAAECVVQKQMLGTADAVRAAKPAVAQNDGFIMVFYGDMPLWRMVTLRNLYRKAESHSGPLVMLTGEARDARGFGRVIRKQTGEVIRILEEAHLDAEQRGIREINLGAYVFRAAWLWSALERVKPSPKGEYYLTDLVEMAAGESGGVLAIPVEDESEWIGVNTRAHLAEAEAAMRRRINRDWMEAGVTLQDPETAFISARAVVGEDTVILANTHLEGATRVGKGCVIGPNTIIRDSEIGDRCRVQASVVEKAVLEEDVDIGPFAHLRSGAYLERGVHMGNFGEVKNSRLGRGAKMGHFSYLGDATVGPAANIGAGTITCNYDGERKNKTEIGEGAFIGSDTMLVAPVKIGKHSRTGAGAVVTKDVPDESLAVGVPARVLRKPAKRED